MKTWEIARRRAIAARRLADAVQELADDLERAYREALRLAVERGELVEVIEE